LIFIWPSRPSTEHPHKLHELIVKELCTIFSAETINYETSRLLRQSAFAFDFLTVKRGGELYGGFHVRQEKFVRNFTFRSFQISLKSLLFSRFFKICFKQIFEERFNERAAHYRERISSVNAFLQIYFKKVTRANLRLPTWQT
jgi:hypothetical protein